MARLQKKGVGGREQDVYASKANAKLMRRGTGK